MYSVEISPAAERDLKKLKKKLLYLDGIISIIDKLSLDPRHIGTRKVKGFLRTFRIRYRSYRIIYDIYEKEERIIVLRILKRSEST
jgi:addiction module RelE/StbE family toxin